MNFMTMTWDWLPRFVFFVGFPYCLRACATFHSANFQHGIENNCLKWSVSHIRFCFLMFSVHSDWRGYLTSVDQVRLAPPCSQKNLHWCASVCPLRRIQPSTIPLAANMVSLTKTDYHDFCFFFGLSNLQGLILQSISILSQVYSVHFHLTPRFCFVKAIAS